MKISGSLVVAVGLLCASPAMAIPLDIHFCGVETADGGGFNSSPAEIALLEGQLLAVFDEVDSDTVSFTFTNSVGLASSLTTLYFDDAPEGSNLFPGLDFSTAALTPSAGVNFGLDAVSPPTPGAGIFGSDVAFGIDAESAGEGINAPTESLVVTLDLTAGYTPTMIEDAILDGSLLIALHVQSIGRDGESDWFLSKPGDPVPEPASLTLLGLGIAGLVVRQRRMTRR